MTGGEQRRTCREDSAGQTAAATHRLIRPTRTSRDQLTTMTGTTASNVADTAGGQHTDKSPGRPSICGEPAVLARDLALAALRYADRPDIDPSEIQDVRCTLQAHRTGDHYAFVVDTSATTSAWTRWSHGVSPQIVLVLPDCPTADPDRGGTCSEYECHQGGHTWQVDDPWNPVVEPAT
jgi:hypothetical protein